MTASKVGFWRRHRWLVWGGSGILLVLAALTGTVLVMAHRAEPMLRAHIVKALEDHFHSHVELDSFHLALRDGLRAEGTGLRIWPARTSGNPQSASTAPLIRLAEFRFHTPLEFKPGRAIRISVVQLRGLNIDVPPRPPHVEDTQAMANNKSLRHPKGAKETGSNKAGAPVANPATPDSRPGSLTAANGMLRFEIEGVECTDAHLTIETSKPGKQPLEFAIAHLKLTSTGSGISADQAMHFEADLTNPRPVGIIHTKGSFGPWVVDDPGESPVEGDYKFEHADLGGFKGIAGILSSIGHYEGALRNLTADGTTETPDFRLTHFGTPMPLHTKFHAKIDGTNGDTWLEPVEATLGRSHFFVRGQVVRIAAKADGKNGVRPGGHDIVLTVNVDRGRIEDFLKLASRSGNPLLTGSLTVKAGLEISPRQVPVDERLKLTGTFALDNAQFSSDKIQGRVAELSARGQGRPKDAKNGDADDVRSTMSGSFQMANRVVTLSALEYTVPGAVIDLKGSYGADGGTLDFVGTARMDATVSAMVGGWKGLLLKPMDRYFQKDGAGTQVPIHIDGTRENPKFGVDFKRMKKTSPQRPDEPN